MENQNSSTVKPTFKQRMTEFGASLKRFCMQNYLMLGYIVASFLVELTAVAVTSGKFYMTAPWLFMTFVAIASLVSVFLPGHKSRLALFTTALVLNTFFDILFVVIFQSTGGTIFDYAMINLRTDAMMIVESLPIDFTFIFVASVTIALYVTLGVLLMRRMPKPDTDKVTRVLTSSLLAGVLTCNILCVYFTNYKYDASDLKYKIYQQETGTYSNKGIIGNMYTELVRGLFFSDTELGDIGEMNDFIYSQSAQPTAYFGTADGFNVVTILCESFEWFSFLYDAERYPNGYAYIETLYGTDNKKPGKLPEKPIEEQIADTKASLRELFPNLYAFYEDDSTVVFDNSYSLEKTDISENKSIIGNYPLYQYINYAYPENSIPYSLPNILKNMYGVESNSFHDGTKTFYNRTVHHTNALGFASYTSSEDMDITVDEEDLEQRNLDSEMISACKDEMFPADRRFNTFITTITMHGQYAERKNLQPYYDKLDEHGILPLSDNENANTLRYYVAATMDLDKAIGIMLDDLEAKGIADKTLITLFGDHNAYYQGITNYVKNIYSSTALNYTELYRVPVMMKVGTKQLGNPTIEKFTCVSDIYPTILDLLGITAFSNLTYGTSAFSEEESLLYSRAYDRFITDKVYFNSLNNLQYRAADVTDEYVAEIERRALELLDKISHVNRIFAADFFKGREDDFYTHLSQARQ